MKGKTMNNNNRFFSQPVQEGYAVGQGERYFASMVGADACRGESLFARIHRLCFTGNLPGERLLFALSLSLFSFASCTQEGFAPNVPEVDGERHEIVLSANLGDIDSEVTPSTRVDADPTKAMTFYFARVDKSTTSGLWANYLTGGDAPSTPLTATRAAGAGNQAITFSTPQYYSMAKLYGQESTNSYNETRFIGWYPQHTSVSNSTVVISAGNGRTDILLSNAITVSYTNQATSSANTLTFKHLLAKITVQVKAADTTAPARWGYVTDIAVGGQYDSYSVALNNGVLTGSSATRPTLEGFATKTLTTSYQNCGSLFIHPSGTSVPLYVTTVEGGSRVVLVSLASGSFTAGTAYTILLDFKSTAIAPSATVSAWGNGGNLPTGAL